MGNSSPDYRAGDASLKTVAGAIAAAYTRAGELVARYGGEEFVVLVPGAIQESIMASAENVRRRIADLGISHPHSTVAPFVTVSIGLAWEQPEAGRSPADLVAEADQALYRAKREGRNCVRVGMSQGHADPVPAPE